jgi:pyridoxamine 5'-phosphate oxidase
MTQAELLRKVDEILDDAKAGVLTTVDKDGKPHVRWLTPGMLKGRPGALYAVTSPRSAKADQLEANPHVEWMIQSRSLNEVVNIKGRVHVIDNPALKSEVIESIGNRLVVFWKVNPGQMDFVVLETIIEEAELFRPMGPERVKVSFGPADE